MILNMLGHEADAVSNGAEALVAISQQSYDVVLLDLNMPVMGGLETARRIRAEFPSDQQPYLIAATATKSTFLKDECLAAGMDYFIAKPYGFRELTAALDFSQSPQRVALRMPPEQVHQSVAADDPIDRSALENLQQLVPTGSMPDLIAEFLRDGKEMMEQLVIALEAGNNVEVRRLAHTLGSTAAQFGAVKLERVAKDIEKLAENNLIEDDEQFFAPLQAEYDTCAVILETIRQSY